MIPGHKLTKAVCPIVSRGFKTIAPFDNRYGPLGRSANSGITATVFGAYGFVGQYFLNELGKTLEIKPTILIYTSF